MDTKFRKPGAAGTDSIRLKPIPSFGSVKPAPLNVTPPLAKSGPSVSRRLHRKQAAGYLGVSLSWLDKNRLTGLGPVFIAIGGRVVYDTADLEAFLERNRRTSTSQQY